MVQRQAASLPPHGSFNRIRSVAPVYPIMVSRAHACAPKRHLDRSRALVMSPGMLRRDISRPFYYYYYYYYFKAHQHKAAGRKTRLDIRNYGCKIMVINRIRSVVPVYPIMVSRAHACASKRHAIGSTGSADQQTDRPGARFTKYLTTILRLSYDNAKVTIEL